jgi:pimeloyl-ACP methyl ester carboxylesterase
LSEGDIDGATAAVVEAWLLPSASPELRERVAAMQSRAFELQLDAPEPPEAPDPVEEDPALLGRIGVPSLVLAGAQDMPDFREGAGPLATALGAPAPTIIEGAGHLAPLETPDAFVDLLLGFLAEHAPAA